MMNQRQRPVGLKGGDPEKFKEINRAYEALFRMEQAKAQRQKDARERQAFLEARSKKAAEARKVADPVVREKAPAAAKLSAKEEDPFWPFSVFKDAPPEDEMQEPAPAAAAARHSVTTDPFGSSKDPEDAAKVSAEKGPFWIVLVLPSHAGHCVWLAAPIGNFEARDISAKYHWYFAEMSLASKFSMGAAREGRNSGR